MRQRTISTVFSGLLVALRPLRGGIGCPRGTISWWGRGVGPEEAPQQGPQVTVVDPNHPSSSSRLPRRPQQESPIPPNVEGPATQAQGGGYCYGGRTRRLAAAGRRSTTRTRTTRAVDTRLFPFTRPATTSSATRATLGTRASRTATTARTPSSTSTARLVLHDRGAHALVGAPGRPTSPSSGPGTTRTARIIRSSRRTRRTTRSSTGATTRGTTRVGASTGLARGAAHRPRPRDGLAPGRRNGWPRRSGLARRLRCVLGRRHLALVAGPAGGYRAPAPGGYRSAAPGGAWHARPRRRGYHAPAPAGGTAVRYRARRLLSARRRTAAAGTPPPVAFTRCPRRRLPRPLRRLPPRPRAAASTLLRWVPQRRRLPRRPPLRRSLRERGSALPRAHPAW